MHAPSLNKTAFNCPHCGAHTTQHWYYNLVELVGGNEPPSVPTEESIKSVEKIPAKNQIDNKKKQNFIAKLRKQITGTIFSTKDPIDRKSGRKLYNVFSSQCYNCGKWTIWANDTIIYPPIKFGPIPNQDLPSKILSVVEEARTIINLSPKGAAALLRLAIQMLCKHLGQPGKNLNSDIAELVKKGLSPMVQKALDIVRVIGNESVHPGELDLNDNKDTAASLFDLVNTIADQMITSPKKVDSIYAKLPQTKREAIIKRDKKK